MANRSNSVVNETLGNIANQIGTAIQASSSSAMEAERQATAAANAFNASQAALNRQFQQASAEREMQFSANEARLAREFSAAESAKQRQFEERLSSTSYQRAYNDLVAAGLNPMLLYTNLNGASTPSGSSAQSFMGSGASASGSSASGYKADFSSAKKSDLSVLSDLVPLVMLSAVTSAISGLNASKTVSKVIDSSVPMVTYKNSQGATKSFRWLGYQSTDAKEFIKDYSDKYKSKKSN